MVHAARPASHPLKGRNNVRLSSGATSSSDLLLKIARRRRGEELDCWLALLTTQRASLPILASFVLTLGTDISWRIYHLEGRHKRVDENDRRKDRGMVR